jgi:glycosyltransferase involved in cell wall biosynthesis
LIGQTYLLTQVDDLVLCKSNRYAQLGVLAYVPLWFEYLYEKGGGGWLRFKKTCEVAPKANITYRLIKFKLGIQPPLISGVLHMLVSMMTALFQSFNTIKKNNVHFILSPVETPQTIILAYMSSKITRRSFVAFLNSVPYYGLVSVSTFKRANKKTSYKVLFETLRTAGTSVVRALLEASMWYIAFRMLRSSATRIICLSPTIASELSDLNIKGHIIPIYPGNGIDCSKVPLVPFRTNGKRYDAIYAAGNFHPEKGIFEVIKIWETVVKASPDAKLVIAGRVHNHYPSVINDLNYLIHSLGLDENVVMANDFLAGITQQELWEKMKQSEIFLYPSRKDVWPLVIGEALACGLPVIAYDLSGIKYAYGDCPAVYSQNVGDVAGTAKTAIELLNDDSLLRNLSHKARQYAENHSWTHVVELERKAYLTIFSH